MRVTSSGRKSGSSSSGRSEKSGAVSGSADSSTYPSAGAGIDSVGASSAHGRAATNGDDPHESRIASCAREHSGRAAGSWHGMIEGRRIGGSGGRPTSRERAAESFAGDDCLVSLGTARTANSSRTELASKYPLASGRWRRGARVCRCWRCRAQQGEARLRGCVRKRGEACEQLGCGAGVDGVGSSGSGVPWIARLASNDERPQRR